MGLVTTGPPIFDVEIGERVRIVRSDPNQMTDWRGYEGHIIRPPGYDCTMGVALEGEYQPKRIRLGNAQIEWLDRPGDGTTVPNPTHKGEAVFNTQTARTKAGVVGQVVYSNTGRIVFETEPQQDVLNEDGLVAKSATTLATELAAARIDTAVDSLFDA